MKKPLVSIIMPTYNRPTTLSRAIDSCLNQTYKNIEVVVVDDNKPKSASRKETEKLMKKYSNEKRVRYIKQDDNYGACKARNKGIECSKGEYVTFLDDDDEYLENNIEKEIEFMLSNDLDVIFCDLIMVDDVTNKRTLKKYNKNFDYTKEGLLKKHLLDIISGGIAFMYKKCVLTELGGFYDIAASQEYILMFNTILSGYKIRYFEFAGAIGYGHSGDKGITGSEKAIEAKKVVLKLVKPHLHLLEFKGRRKVLFRLNLFIFVQYVRRKDLRAILYAFKIIPYIDLFIIKLFSRKNKNKENDVIYI